MGIKISVFLFVLMAIFNASADGDPQQPPNLCKALTFPNALLLPPFSKIKLKKACAPPDRLYGSSRRPKKRIGCYYKIPFSWADNINFPQLAELGLMIQSKTHTTCPPLTYEDFEVLTFKGSAEIESILWKTFQINRVKRILKRGTKTPPSGSPPVIEPHDPFVIHMYRNGKLWVPLMGEIIPSRYP